MPGVGTAPWQQPSPAPARFPRTARGQAPRARPGASLGGKGFRGKKNNFPRLSCAALGFLLTFLGYILLFRVTQSSLLKCYVCLAESARLSPGLSRRGWMYMNLDFVPPNEEKLVLKLSSDSALMSVLTYLHFFQPLKKKEKKNPADPFNLKAGCSWNLFCLSFPKTLLHSTEQQ